MKKVISFLLSLVLIFGCFATPVAFASEEENLPIVYIRGNGETIYDADGNVIAVAVTDYLGNITGGGYDTETIAETCANILLPLLVEGLLMDKWDNYGKAIYEELYPVFKGAELDENGNPKYGSGISAERIAASEAEARRDTVNYDLFDYNFMYDWRLSPYDHVDRLHEYVLQVLKTTQKDQVCMFSSCLGGALLTAYLERYGHLGLVKNVMFKETLSNESTIISKAFSGQIELDAKGIERYLAQMDYCAEIGMPGGFAFTDLLNEIIFKTIDLLNQVNVTDTVLGGVEELYAKLYKALMPALCHATGFATQPIYWACVSEKDFDAALNLLFDKEGSETRIKYEGLLEKILYYREHCTAKLDELYRTFEEDYGIYVGFVARYGYANPPITKDSDKLSDFLVSLDAATKGATCAKIGQTLSDEYIEKRIAEGKGEYISPDRQVDLSTALYPDRTWVLKNAHHSYSNVTDHIVYDFLKGTEFTVHSEGAYAQFAVCFEKENRYEPMTTENCDDYDWISTPEENPTTTTKIAALLRFVTLVIKLLTKLINSFSPDTQTVA